VLTTTGVSAVFACSLACERAPAPSGAAAASTGAASVATVDAPAAPSASASAVASAAAPPAFDPYPGGRAIAGLSNLPTVAEWNAQTKEVTVKGSSALRCETKMVREWLRVSCGGKNDTGGAPTGVTVTQGAGEGVYAFVAGGVATLVMPFVEGASVAATFSWTDKSHALAVVWPRGKPEPVVLGVFAGAASPLDFPPVPRVPGDLACECDIAINGSSMCLPKSWLGDVAACEKKHLGDCRAMIACADDWTKKP